jgi:hypothetical protein
MPKKSPARAIHCAQHQRLTMSERQFARETGTTWINGFSGALFR